MNIAQVGSIILRLPSKESRMDFLVNLLLPQDKTSLDSLLVISFSTSILSNRCASHGCCKDWKIDRLSPIIFHDLWHLWLAVCWTLWKLENWPKLLTQLDCQMLKGKSFPVERLCAWYSPRKYQYTNITRDNWYSLCTTEIILTSQLSPTVWNTDTHCCQVYFIDYLDREANFTSCFTLNCGHWLKESKTSLCSI